MKWLLWIILLLSLDYASAFAQCEVPSEGNSEPVPSNFIWSPSETVRIIPVVVHLIKHIDGPEIQDDQVLTQINVLNEDFRQYRLTPGQTSNTFSNPDLEDLAADTKIEFRLAQLDPDDIATSGITRTNTSVESFSPSANLYKYTNSGGHDVWDPTRYLNMWVCELSSGNGIAQFPELLGFESAWDEANYGIVIDQDVFGDNVGTATFTTLEFGNTATHEVGHFLGLFHPYHRQGPSNSPEPVCDATGQNCAEHGDLVCDTPPLAAKGKDDRCPTTRKECPFNNPTIEAQVPNHMDNHTDACRNLFTWGQSERMDFFIDNDYYLSLLVNSDRITSKDFIVFSDHSDDHGYDYVSSSRIVTESSVPLAPMAISSRATMRSKSTIKLQHGFSVFVGSEFHASIDAQLPQAAQKRSESIRRNFVLPAKQVILSQTYPNPFSRSTAMVLDVYVEGVVRLEVFDVTGRLVQILHNGYLHSGSHQFTFEGVGLNEGLYYCRLSAGSQVQTVSMSLKK